VAVGATRKTDRTIDGRVVATLGRRVVVRVGDVERVCYLSGQRAVIGDRVRLLPMGEDEGKLVEVLPRERALSRADFKGSEQAIAAWLGGIVVVASADQPAYRPGLVDRYLVGASASDLPAVLCLTKVDLGVSAEVEADLAMREREGYAVERVCTRDGAGLERLAARLASEDVDGPWAFVGHSGVGKTSLVQALLPGVDVGPIGEISEYWEAGRHTTTHSRIFALPGGGEVADSPGIRTFLPSGLTPMLVRDHFPGLPRLACRYRDCLHRPGEDGCLAESEVAPDVLVRYRRMVEEVKDGAERADRGRGGGAGAGRGG
jgi:ribosome biogenesis GTPase